MSFKNTNVILGLQKKPGYQNIFIRKMVANLTRGGQNGRKNVKNGKMIENLENQEQRLK